MELRTRDHVPALTGLLTVSSLALIFGAVLGLLPGLPRAPDAILTAIPHVNAAVSVVAVGTIAFGWRSIRRGEVDRHRIAMLVSLALFATFLTLYLYRVSLLGPSGFAGPDIVYTYIYLPILAVHMVLAVVCIPLLYYVLLLALTRPVSELPATDHRRVGRVAASLWLISFTLGTVVYLMLYVIYGHGG